MSRLRKATRSILAALAVTVLAGGGLTGGVYAAEWPSFEEVDKNADGVIDAQEALTLRGFNFGAADKNKDGKISKSDYETAMKEQGGKSKKGS